MQLRADQSPRLRSPKGERGSRSRVKYRETAKAAKLFIKPDLAGELRREIDLFCELFTRPAVEAGLRKFVESTDALPYLP